MTWNVFAVFHCIRPLTLPSFEVVLDRREEGSFLNIYKLQGTPLQKGGAIQSRLRRKPPPQKKQTKQMAQKVIFQMATVKGVFVSSKICSNRHLTKCSKGKGQMERKSQRESTQCTQWEEGIFWWAAKDVFWGKEVLLEASDLLFHQKALAWCQGVGLVSNSATFCATAAS